MLKQPDPAMVQPYLYPDLKIPERDVVRMILSRYEWDKRVFVYRNNTGSGQFVYPGGKRSQFIRFGLPGAADILGILKTPRGGIFLAIEAKATGGKQTPEQKAYQLTVEQYGGLYILARGQTALDDVENAIRGALG